MGKLDGSVCYLSGAMEFASDHGVGWRKKFVELIDKYALHIDIIDPTNKPPVEGLEGVEVENIALQRQLQATGRFQKLQQMVHDYRRYDLRVTDYSNFLVIMIDPTIPQWGTANEVYLAETQHKPLFFVNEGGLYKLPRWLFDVVDTIHSHNPVQALTESNVYVSLEDVVKELVTLDKGEKPLTDEWILVRKAIELRRYWKFS